MRRWVRCSVLIVILAGLSLRAAQSQQGSALPQSAFEVASIRPAHLTQGCFSMLPPGGTQYAVTCFTLRNLIGIAYKTSYIDGGGSALDTYYDVRATAPGGVPWTFDTVHPMMQQLLSERFHLRVHTGKRELSGYGLFVAKGGSKLHPAAPGPVAQGQKAGEPSRNFIYPGQVQGRSVNASGIAGLFSALEHAPVVDHTGLSGTFNVDLSYAPDNSTDSNLPSFFTAIEEELGLKLKPEKVTVDTVVIDHVDDAPTPN
jgi:uncharacterized protein (TIGR03435 family)